MAERIGPLEGSYAPGRSGAATPTPGVWLRQRAPAAIWAVTGQPVPGVLPGPADAVGEVDAEGAKVAFLPLGAHRWLAVGMEAGEPQLRTAVATAVRSARCFELSHARVLIEVGGPGAEDLLAKGCPLDLRALEPGRCASSLLGPFQVTLHRYPDGEGADDAPRFGVFFTRSYALSGWAWLLDAAAELGCEVRPALHGAPPAPV